jgi:endonuclease/exonuclease/phosphatase family metal-dependent hydrolase
MSIYIRVVTWNIGGWQLSPTRSLACKDREQTQAPYDFTLQRHLARIMEIDPDILLTQEMARNAAAPRNRDWVAEIQRTSLRHAAWFGRPLEGGEAGNAVHSKYPLRDAGGFLVAATLPKPIPHFRHNTVKQPVVAATCTIFGIPLYLRGVHYPGDGTNLGPENAWSQQTEVTKAVRASLPPPGGDFIVAGDLNAGPSAPSFKLLRDDGFRMDNDPMNVDGTLHEEWGLDFILRAGRNLRKVSFACHLADSRDGWALSDHDLIEVMYAVEEPTEDHFRAISDWTARSGGRYFGGWPRMQLFIEPVFGYEFCVFKPGRVDWRDVPASEQRARDTRTRFTAAHDWARANGYEHGFPNFHETGAGTAHVFGTFLIKPGTGEWRDVPIAELNLPDPPFVTPMERWLRGVDDYAQRHGYVGGLPTGHSANHGRGHVCGVWLYRSEVAERRFLTPNDVGRQLSTPDPTP